MKSKRAIVSTTWVCVMFNMAFADIVGFLNPGALEDILEGTVGFEVTQELLLVFSILIEVPIIMILLSKILPIRVNRWANIIAVIITTFFIVGGGNFSLSYVFFASVEILLMGFIIWHIWNWSVASAK